MMAVQQTLRQFISDNKTKEDYIKYLINEETNGCDSYLELAAKNNNMREVNDFLPFEPEHAGTALWRACQNGNIDIVKLLIKQKYITYKDIERALRGAVHNEHIHIVKFLLKYPKNVETALDIASEKITKIFINY
jgi:hypothetical protein